MMHNWRYAFGYAPLSLNILTCTVMENFYSFVLQHCVIFFVCYVMASEQLIFFQTDTCCDLQDKSSKLKINFRRIHYSTK